MFKGLMGLALAAAFAICVVAVSGCGGSSSEDALTKSEFVKQGNVICEESAQERSKIVGEVVEEADPNGNVEAAQNRAVTEIIPVYEETAQQLGELGVPAGDEKQVEAIVEAMEAAAERALADPHTAVISNAPFREADKLAEGYGLKACTI